MITCHVRYIIDPYQIDAFERYSRSWIAVVARLGGQHHGYFLSAEGANNIAYCLFSFASLVPRPFCLSQVKQEDGMSIMVRPSRSLTGTGATFALSRPLADRFQIHSLRAQYIRSVVIGMVMGPDSRRPIVLSASCSGGRVERIDLLTALRDQSDVHPVTRDRRSMQP